VAALVSIVPVAAGAASAGAAVSASDTIDQATLGARGVYLEILNGGGSSDTVTISDFGSTDSGNPLTSNTYTVTVANGTNKVIFIKPYGYNPATGLITVAHSFTTSVTYKLYPVQ